MTDFARCRGVTPAPSNKKWRPGNYIGNIAANQGLTWDKTGSGAGTEGQLQRLRADASDKWRGALLAFAWTDLEGNTLGDYTAGMATLKGYLDQMSVEFPTKGFVIFVAIRTFSSSDHAVPLYMRNSATYSDGKNYFTTRNGVTNQGSFNGEYAYESSNGGPGGFVPNMHVAAVRDRLKALMLEIATRFNDHPALECVTLSESAISEPIGSVGAASDTVGGVVITRPNTDGAVWLDKPNWYDGTTNAFTDMKTNFTNTQVSQWINFTREDLKTWVPDLRAIGVGLGMNDVCPDDKGFNFRNDIPGFANADPGNIQHLQESNGTAIIMGHVARPALDGTVVGRCQTSGAIQNQPKIYPAYPGVGVSRQAVRDFGVGTVGITHLVWTHNTANQPVTGEVDPNIPSNCAQNDWTHFPGYQNRKYNVVTDEWINDPTSDITTITTRPTGW